MNRDITESIARLTHKIVVFDCIILLVLTGLAMMYSAHSKQRLAEQFSEAFRAPLIAGDNRQIMLDMARPVSMDFIGFAWKPLDKASGFVASEELKSSNRLLCRSITVGIYFDEDKSIKAGDLEFYYNRWSPLPAALSAWLLLVLISATAGYYERKRMLREYALSLESGINESRANLAAQVAHDIRSPLVALDAALKHADQLPEKQRVMVRRAANRIRDIANNLLEKNRQKPGATSTSAASHVSGEPQEVRLLSSLIDQVITEKRLQFESKPGVNINFDLSREAYGLFADIQPVEFDRLVSNLVNNAVEALGDKGAVDVRLAREANSIVLTISDNGKGIPPEILTKLGRKGETHGKVGGSGLGLFHARSTAEGWGGSLAIASTPGKGTSVAIKLPAAQTPSGFVAALSLTPGNHVVVLDDDPGIHQLWQCRFESACVIEHGIDVLHFSEPAALRAWVKAEPAKSKTAVCLFDYELSGFTETGLSLAEELGLCGQTILVSSRCEEKRIIEYCVRLGVRRIPKSLSDFVPITISALGHTAPARAVLLDDDTLTHMNWEDAAAEHGIELLAFTDPAKFLAAVDGFSKDIPLYIDSELGDNIKGEDIAAGLREKGFTNICLTTGHSPERFAHLSWLRVISKEAPWGEKTKD